MRVSGRRLALVLVFLLGAALALYLPRARSRLRASAIANQVENLTHQLVESGRLSHADPAAGRALQAGLEALRQAAEDDPAEVAVPMAQAALYRLLGSSQAAVRAYEEGLAIESRPEIYAQLGHTLWSAGDQEGARLAFRRAVQLNHNLARELRIYLPELEEQHRRQRQQRPARRRAEQPLFADSFESGAVDGWSGAQDVTSPSRPGRGPDDGSADGRAKNDPKTRADQGEDPDDKDSSDGQGEDP